MFDIIGFVGVPNEFVIAIKVEKGISYDLDLVILVYVGACRVEVVAGFDGFGNACFNLFKIFVKGILLSDLAEVIQGFDVTAAGGLLVGSRGLDGVTGNIDKDILRDINREINPEGKTNLSLKSLVASLTLYKVSAVISNIFSLRVSSSVSRQSW